MAGKKKRGFNTSRLAQIYCAFETHLTLGEGGTPLGAPFTIPLDQVKRLSPKPAGTGKVRLPG